MFVVRVRIAALVACVAALPACFIDVDYSGTRFRCDVDNTCPVGFTCDNGFCVDTGGADIDAGINDGDAGGDAGPPAAATCGAVANLHDDFEDGVADARWFAWSQAGASHDETGGKLRMYINAGDGNAWTGYLSAHVHDLRAGHLRVHVEQVGGYYTILEARDTRDIRVQLLVEDGSLLASVLTGDSSAVRVSIPYEAATHRWWQMREQSGTLYWETSSDGAAWTVLHSEPAPLDTHLVQGGVAVGIGVASDSEAVFDDFNIDGADQPWCPASGIVDDFSDGVRGTDWARSYVSNGCSLAEGGGVATITMNGPDDVWCGYEAVQPRDLRGDRMAVEIVQALSAPNTFSYFKAAMTTSSSRWVEISLQPDLTFIIQDTEPWEMSIAYDPVAHRWWQIREQSNTLYWETSPDGVSWTTRATHATPFDLGAVHVEVGGGVYGGTLGSPDALVFDNVNNTP